MNRQEDFDAQRRQILRRISLLTWGLIGAAVLLAVAGGALLAWVLQGAGLPFLRTWLITSLLLLAIPGAAHLAQKGLFRRGGPDESG